MLHNVTDYSFLIVITQSNILIDNNETPKIADFGIGRLVHCTQAFSEITRRDSTSWSLRWMAPELLNQHRSVGSDNAFPSNGGSEHKESFHTKESDVWAFGMVQYVREYVFTNRYFL